MAVIAAGIITLSFERDILANYRYYKLQSSTATPPTKPTSIATLPPSGWTDTEPTYTEGSTNTLYTVDLTTYTDGTFYYTPVMTSSSYEAAKSAYNKAVAAQNIANAAQESIDNLEIGGRNLLKNTSVPKTTTCAASTTNGAYSGIYTKTDYGLEWNKGAEVGDLYTVSFDWEQTGDSTAGHFYGQFNGGVCVMVKDSAYVYWTADELKGHAVLYCKLNSSQITVANATNGFRIRLSETSGAGSATVTISNVKLEKGGKATDWTPAPEDTEQAISDSRSWYAECSTDGATAAKVATITPATTAFTLHAGVIVSVKFTNLNSGAVASLTLNVNGTGAKNIKYISNKTVANLPGVDYILAGQTYQFYYDGTYWIMQLNYNTNDNNYDRIRFQVAITAGVAITAKNIIVADANGKYSHLKRGVAFDITYPILYASSAISVNATGTNNYLAFYFAIATTQSITLTANKAVYIKGTLSGTTFTPVSTAPLTQTIPTSVDGYQYIRLGFAYSTANIYMDTDHSIYEYNNGGFKTTSQIANEARERVQAMFNNLNGVDQFNALTQNGALNGIFYSDSGNAYINAAFIKTGSLAADKIAVTDLQAFGATIGGFDVNTTSIHTHNVAVTSNADNSVALSSDLFTRTLGGVSRDNLKLAIGANFGVGKDGTLYATNGVFTGTISGSTIIFNVESEGVDYSLTASANSWSTGVAQQDVTGTLFTGTGGFGVDAALVDITAKSDGVFITSLTDTIQQLNYGGQIILQSAYTGHTWVTLAMDPSGSIELALDDIILGPHKIKMDYQSLELDHKVIFLNAATSVEIGTSCIGTKNGGYLGYVGGISSSESLADYWTQGQYSVSNVTNGRPNKSNTYGILLSFMGTGNEDLYTDDYAHSWGLQLYCDNDQLYYRAKTKAGVTSWRSTLTTYKDFTVTLGSMTWNTTGAGMYYSNAIMSTTEAAYWDHIESVSLTGSWSNLKKTDFIIPYISGTNVYLMSNVNSFYSSTNSKVGVRVTGRRGAANS